MDSGASRRSFVTAFVGGLTATAGCLVLTGDDRQRETTTTTTPSSTDEATAVSETPSPTPEPSPSPDLGRVWVTDSVVYIVNVDGHTVTGSPDRSQYVFAAYEGSEGVDPDQFRLVVDGDVYRHGPPDGTDYRDVILSVEGVGGGQPLVGFTVPVREAVEAATLEYGGGEVERELPPAAMRRLTFDPEFEVREFSLPDSVDDGEPAEAELTVTNVGGGPGTFRAAAPAGGMLATIVERTVDAGEVLQFTEEIELRGASGGENYSVPLSWADGRRTETVRVEPTPTESG